MVESRLPRKQSGQIDRIVLHWEQQMAAQISKKRKFVADGVFRAELGEFFERELAEEGYSGCEVRVTHARTEVSTFIATQMK